MTNLTDINVAFHDRVVGGLMDTGGFHTNERRLKEGLGAAETLVTDGDDLRDLNQSKAEKSLYNIMKNTEIEVSKA